MSVTEFYPESNMIKTLSDKSSPAVKKEKRTEEKKKIACEKKEKIKTLGM